VFCRMECKHNNYKRRMKIRGKDFINRQQFCILDAKCS
jgi:hypothetical protein